MDPLNPVRVLVVEDNPDTAESLRCILVECGFHVAVAHNTKDGLRTARQLEPQVVLCDIGLPDGDGYTVGSMLRQSAPTQAARLIAVTGHAEPTDRQRALAAGFDQHLAKPVDPATLLRELELTL